MSTRYSRLSVSATRTRARWAVFGRSWPQGKFGHTRSLYLQTYIRSWAVITDTHTDRETHTHTPAGVDGGAASCFRERCCRPGHSCNETMAAINGERGALVVITASFFFWVSKLWRVPVAHAQCVLSLCGFTQVRKEMRRYRGWKPRGLLTVIFMMRAEDRLFIFSCL